MEEKKTKQNKKKKNKTKQKKCMHGKTLFASILSFTKIAVIQKSLLQHIKLQVTMNLILGEYKYHSTELYEEYIYLLPISLS